MIKNVEIVVVGAGLAGCVLAERLACELNKKVLLVDRRNHIAGNCHDTYDDSGILIHKYGPHYFRTNNLDIINYLSQFTSWIDGNYIVKSFCNGQFFPFPVNINTLEQFFKVSLSKKTARELVEKQREKIEYPGNSEELVLSKIGRQLFEAFYLNYTLKQWGKYPHELDASVCGRIPVRFNRDNRYVDHLFQLMPAQGYTAMLKKMIDHPTISLLLNTDFKKLNIDQASMVIYTGAIDEYFNSCYGQLPWRSLHFEYKHFNKKYVQPCVQINYPNDYEYTRSVEIKHVTKQKHPHTTVAYEYPIAKGDPYYPIPTTESKILYEKYKLLAEKETQENNVYFIGRLAEYAYLNMDEVIERALLLFQQIKINCSNWHLLNQFERERKENNKNDNRKKYCVISAVGVNSLHREWIKNTADFDLHLIIYDNSYDKFYNDTDFIHQQKGYKFKLIYDYFIKNPIHLDRYEYFFIPDDDILIDTDGISKLFQFMQLFNLQIAQPALSNSYFTYPHTEKNRFCVLRFTNFVEMMAPCFSKEALRKVLFTFNENNSGWGIEYHWPHLIKFSGKEMAIIDDLYAEHTRPIQSNNQQNFKELNDYINKFKLKRDIEILDYIPISG